MKKYFLFFILVLLIGMIFLFYKISPLFGSSIFMPSYNKVNKFYIKNYAILCDVVSYMQNEESDMLRWDCDENDVISDYNSSQKIYISDNSDLQNDIQFLYDNNIEHILKEHNYIKFVFWGSLDSSCGLVYSEDVSISIEDTKFKYISNNWYYYLHVAD